MKKLILTLTLITSSAFAQTSYVADLIGTWTLVEIACTDGSTPKLPLNPSLATMELNYNGADFVATVTAMGLSQKVTGTYSATKNIITMTENKTGRTETAGYVISNKNELVMFKGQGCASGQVMMTTFTKNP